MDLDQPATEEFIQHYAQKYSDLKKALNFKETFSEVKPRLLRKALGFTSNLQGDLYTPAKCVEEEKFLVNISQKFFDYDSKSESSGTESSEEKEDTEDSK